MSGERATKNNVAIPYHPIGGSGDYHSPIPDDFARPHVAPFNAQYMQSQVVTDDWQTKSYPKSSRDLVVPPVLGPNFEYLQSNLSPTSIDPRYYRLRTYQRVDNTGQSTKTTGLGDFIDWWNFWRRRRRAFLIGRGDSLF
jgi:hypothetical protein